DLTRRLAEVLWGQGQPARATALYRRLIERAPDDWELRMQLADLLMTADPAAAEAELRAISAGQPDYPGVQQKLGRALRQAGRLNEALDFLRRAGERAPADVGIRLETCEILVELGYLDLAINVYRQALELDPGRVEIQLGLARALHRQGHRDEA